MTAGAVVALLLLAATPAAEESAPDRPVSLIVGRWQGESGIVGVPCPEDNICLNVIGDVRVGDVRTLAGPRVPRELIARFEFHAPIIDSYDIVLIVRRASDTANRFEARRIGSTLLDRPVCVEPSVLEANAIPMPARARTREGLICMPGRTWNPRD